MYLKELQASFDYGKIKYTEDYYDIDMNPAAEPTAPEWKVYFEGNFWGHSGRDRAGVEIKLNKHFVGRGIIGLSLRCILAQGAGRGFLYACRSGGHPQVHSKMEPDC